VLGLAGSPYFDSVTSLPAIPVMASMSVSNPL
jgi:hypothetical protein